MKDLQKENYDFTLILGGRRVSLDGDNAYDVDESFSVDNDANENMSDGEVVTNSQNTVTDGHPVHFFGRSQSIGGTYSQMSQELETHLFDVDSDSITDQPLFLNARVAPTGSLAAVPVGLHL